ncbi:hypothetical protein Vretimale_3526 [Volvox reticuliferus]|uniref:Uncharacterized protein n=1 Tax=Volvox reticuliferus TaxID=1737510 RepID=A0A8J4D8R6_9CHLO|nr:hypothetical protein Vretimale_3526 [Volvox reticuliferus]
MGSRPRPRATSAAALPSHVWRRRRGETSAGSGEAVWPQLSSRTLTHTQCSGGGSGGGGVGGGGGGGRSAGGGRIKSDGAVGADDEALPDLPDSKQDIKSIKPRPPVLDYSQYYPTILPLRVPGEEIWEEADGGPAFQPSALDLAAMPDVPQHPAEDLELFDPEMEDQMFLMQMPGVLPLKPGGGAAAAAGDGGGGAGPGPSSERRRKEAAAATASE